MNGPPFSISEEEVEDLYGTHFSIDKLVAKNVIDDEPGLKSRGLTELTETAYKLTRK
jgi:thiopurine S-methyltransferase